MIGDTKIKKAIIATLFTMLLATAAYATTWYYLTTKYGGYIPVYTGLEGFVEYSYNGTTWVSTDLPVYKNDTDKDSLYVAFNITSLPEPMYLLLNFTLYFTNNGTTVYTHSLEQSVTTTGLIVCDYDFAPLMVGGQTYRIKVDIYKAV